jgi:hypothetical protein
MSDEGTAELELRDPETGDLALRVRPSQLVTKFATETEPTRVYRPTDGSILTLEIFDADQPGEDREVLIDLDVNDVHSLAVYFTDVLVQRLGGTLTPVADLELDGSELSS